MDDVGRLESYYFHQHDFETRAGLREWFSWEVPQQFNIAEYVCDRWADENKNKVALYVKQEDGKQTAHTYKQLRYHANRFANYLADRGIGAGDRIAINGTQRVESLVAHLAAFKLRAVSVPLTVLLGTNGLRYRLTDCEATAFVVDEQAVDTLRSIRGEIDLLELVVTTDDFDRDDEVAFWEAIDGHSPEFSTPQTDAEETAFIMYTSGTTGQPKGVVHAHQNLLGQLPQFLTLQRHDTSDDQVARTVSEWSWIMSLPGMILPALFYGMSVVAYPSRGFEPEREFELAEQFGVTHLNLPPTAVRMMRQVDRPKQRFDLSSLQSLSTGGESADQGIIDWTTDVFENAAFIEGYGTTETGGLVCDDPAMDFGHRTGYFGVPSVGHEIAVLDPETREPIDKPGEIGELAVQYGHNPLLFREYLGKPERTRKTINDGWLLSDDLVSADEDGYLKFHARHDDLIISSGYRIAPIEIEEELLSHEAVKNAGVIGVPDETRGETPKAFVELSEGYDPSDERKEKLQTHVKDGLASYEYPREIEFVEELPQTTTGKIRRQSLRKREGVIDE